MRSGREDDPGSVSQAVPGMLSTQSLLEKLPIQKHIHHFKRDTRFSFGLYEVLSHLVYARGEHRCSEQRMFHNVLTDYVHNPGNAPLLSCGGSAVRITDFL